MPEAYVPRFQSWFSNRAAIDKIGTVYGMLLACIDRCVEARPSKALANLMLEFLCVDVPLRAI